MSDLRTNSANNFQTELTQEMGPTDLEAVVATLAGGPASPSYLQIIQPAPSTIREYILFDGVFGANSFVTTNIINRYLEGSSASSGLTHPVGSIVRMSPLKQHLDDLHDRVDTRLRSSAHTLASHTAMGLTNDHGALSGLGDNDHPQYALKTELSTSSLHTFTLMGA